MPYIIPISILFILSAGYFSSVLDGSNLLIERDLSIFFIPPRELWVEAVKNWELPLWNPYYYSGHPLLATLQPGIFYPINVLLLVLPFDLAFNWTIIIHFFIAGVFTFMLLKEIGASRSGSFAGALTFMLSGYLFSAHNVMSTLFAVAWTPLALFLFLRALRRESYAYSVATGLSFTAMFLGGGIEVLFGTAVFTAFIALVPSTIDLTGEGESAGLLRRVLFLLTALATFFLVSAVQLLPFLELSRLTTRAGGLSFYEATVWSFDLKDITQFFIPDPYGYGTTNEKYWSNQSWLKTIYTGATPFILSVFFYLRYRLRVLPFIFLALSSIAVSMGKNVQFYYYLYEYLPFFGKIRYPVKFLFVFFVLLSISAGMGFDILRKDAGGSRNRHRPLSFFLLAAAFIASAAFGALSYFDADAVAWLVKNGYDYPEYNYVKINVFNIKRELFFFTAASVSVYLWLNSAPLKKALPYLVLGLLSIDLFFAHQGYYASADAKDYHKKGAVAEFLSKDASLYRVLVTPRTKGKWDWPPPFKDPYSKVGLKGMELDKERLYGYNLLYRVFDADGVEVLRRMEYTYLYDLVTAKKRPDETNLLAMLNVKYVVSSPKIDSKEMRLVKVLGAPDKDSKRMEEANSIKIYENLNYLPRFYLVDDFRIMKDADEYLETLISKDFHPGKTVLLDEEPGYKTGGRKAACAGVKVLSYSLNSVTLKSDCASDAMLVASEAYYPGWKAFVDGSERKIYKANLVQRAIKLEAGVHVISFEYRPLSFRAGALISAVSVLALAAWLGVCAVKRR